MKNETPNTIIRLYKKTDWPQLCHIHDRARIDELRGSVDLAAFKTLEETAEGEGLFEGELWVATYPEKVVGFVAFNPDEITWIYVDPDYYRKGIGKALMQFAIEKCDDTVYICVLSGNASAIKLYEKMGFKEIERKKGKMVGNEDFEAEGVTMELKKG